jgi:hypothetical protein
MTIVRQKEMMKLFQLTDQDRTLPATMEEVAISKALLFVI